MGRFETGKKKIEVKTFKRGAKLKVLLRPGHIPRQVVCFEANPAENVRNKEWRKTSRTIR